MTTNQTNIFDFINEESTKSIEGFTFVEMFAGIGGVSFGLERVGGRCLLAAEYDPEREGKRQFAQETYKILHPETPVTGDVSLMNKDNTPEHDVLSATFPCQSFSLAGKRGGFNDARGTAFFEVVRLANEMKPKVIFAENVKGLVSHDKGKTLDTIVKAINDIGYRVDFEVMNSKYFGVPQNRERIFIVAVREDLVENEPWNIEGNTVVPKGKRRISGYGDVKTFNFDWPSNTSVEKRLSDVLEAEVDEKFYLSDDKVEQLFANMKATSERSSDVTEPEKLGGLWGNKQAGSMWDPNKIAPTIKTNSGGYSEPLIPEPQIEVLGSSSDTSNHGTHKVYSIEGLSPTILSRDFKDPKRTLVEDDSKYRIRKLTPKECWRLQGFTDEQHDAVEAAGISNSQRYKQAGNAVTVNVIEALGERLLTYL